MKAGWPLVGRDREMALLDSALRDGPDTAGLDEGGWRSGPAVVLVGDAGVGKTRLLREAVDRARAAHRTTHLVVATAAGASVPLGAISHLLPAAATAAAAAGSVNRSARASLLRAAAARLARVRDPLLAVDDAHLLDDASAAFVHHAVVHRLAAVVLTVCSGNRTPDAIVALWKDGLARRVQVEPLAPREIDRLVDHALPGQVSGLLRTKLRAIAAGNPLHLRELLLSGIESGALHQRDGFWHWRGPLRPGERLSDLVQTRLDQAGSAGRAAVELVACGQPVPLDLLVDTKSDSTALAAAERAALIEVVPEGRRAEVRLADPIYCEVLRSTLRPLRTREIFQTLATRLAATPLRRRDDLLRLATWQLAAGIPVAPDVLHSAARQAAARHDLPLAERLARHGAEAGDPKAVRLLADVLHWQGRHHDSVALLSIEPPGGTPPRERARWLVAKARTLYWGLARPEEAVTTLQAARSLSGDPADIDAVRAMMLLFDGQCREALDIATALLDGPPTDRVDARLWACTTAVLASSMLGRTERALTLADEEIRLAEGRPGQVLPGLARLRVARGHALLMAGLLVDAWEAAEHGYQQVLDTGDRALAAEWACLRGVVAQVRGDLTTAVAALSEAVGLAQQQDPTGLLRFYRTILAGVLAMNGQPVMAEEKLRDADETPHAVAPLLVPQAEINRAWVVAAAGDLPGAAAVALRAAAVARRTGQVFLEATALHDAARHGAAHRVYGRLERLAAEADSPLVAGYAELAGALADRDAARLRAVAGTFEELDAPILAAEAAGAAAEHYRRAGMASRAAAAAEHARTLAARCPGARTPGLLLLQHARDLLTAREREIALLAARPMTSPEIARRLHLSVRTVDNHLAHAYAKLGVTNRTQLAQALAIDAPG